MTCGIWHETHYSSLLSLLPPSSGDFPTVASHPSGTPSWIPSDLGRSSSIGGPRVGRGGRRILGNAGCAREVSAPTLIVPELLKGVGSRTRGNGYQPGDLSPAWSYGPLRHGICSPVCCYRPLPQLPPSPACGAACLAVVADPLIPCCRAPVPPLGML
jgi:hypothetical protein